MINITSNKSNPSACKVGQMADILRRGQSGNVLR